jgi:hypothetical protein
MSFWEYTICHINYVQTKADIISLFIQQIPFIVLLVGGRHNDGGKQQHRGNSHKSHSQETSTLITTQTAMTPSKRATGRASVP